MTLPRAWPATLDAATGERVTPTCPTFCCYRETCPTWMQQGINPLFVNGRLTTREQCPRFTHLAELTRRELGVEPPATATELTGALGERRAIREET
jgi:hypothetical protein